MARLESFLQPLNNPSISDFMDAIITATEAFEEHLRTLTVPLYQIIKGRSFSTLSNCLLAYEQLAFCGHNMAHWYIFPDPKNLAKMQKTPISQTMKGCALLYPFADFDQKYIKDFDLIAASLTNVTRIGTQDTIIWTVKNRTQPWRENWQLNASYTFLNYLVNLN